MKISFIIPVYNNFEYTNHIYKNLKEFYPEDEIVISDGGSSDETIEYFNKIDDPNLIFLNNGKMSLCQNYNKGVEKATQDIVVLLHNDMFVPPNFKEKILVDLTENSIVSFSRIEPPVFPGEEPGKIVRDFGYDLNTLNKKEIINFCEKYDSKYQGGGYLFIACYKKNYLGLDDNTYNPPQGWCADNDLHIRYILTGMPRIISDACVYHFVSKTSRKDNNYQQVEYNSNRNFIRKWGFRNSQYNIKYNIGFIINNCGQQLLEVLEPRCSTIYIDCDYKQYIEKEQPNTSFDLQERIKPYNNEKQNEILVSFDASKLNQNNFQLLQQLPDIIKDSGEVVSFQIDIFTIYIIQMNEYQNTLIKI